MQQSEQKRPRVSQVIEAQGRFDNALQIVNTDIEKTLISCVYHDPALFPALAEIVQPGDFYILSHGFHWYAFEQVYPNIDHMTVLAELEKRGDLDTRQTLNWIDEVIAIAPDLRAAETYAQIVRETAVVIRVLNSTQDMRQTLFNKSLTLEEKLDTCNQVFFKASEQTGGQKPTSARYFVQSVADEIELLREQGGARFMPTGFRALDELIVGAACGEVTVLAGAGGGGKTTMMLNMLYNLFNGARKPHTALFTLEMSGQEVMKSMAAIHTDIPKRAFKKGDLSDHQWQTFVEAMQYMADWPLSIVDRGQYPKLSPVQLRRRLRRMLMEQPVDLVVVDGLWLMEASEPTINRPRDISMIMRDLTEIAEAFNLPILLLHQYSREGMLRQSTNRPPTIFDLAEGSSVERTSQSIIGMVRRSLYGTVSGEDLTEVHILKDRSGGESVGKMVKMKFEGGRFWEVGNE